MAPGGKAACTGCSRRKLKCEDVLGQEACKECAAKERPCARPAPGRKRCKKACALCKGDKLRCEESGQGPACSRCVDLNVDCSFVVDEGPAANQAHTVPCASTGVPQASSPAPMHDEENGVLAPVATLSGDVYLAAADDGMTGSTSASTPVSPLSPWLAKILAPSP